MNSLETKTIFYDHPVEWKVSDGLIEYEDAVAFMEQRVLDIHKGQANELIWLLEHPALLTAGTSAKDHDILNPEQFPIHRAARGGQYTYHGPGQRVIYVMLDLTKRGRDVRKFVSAMEEWVIKTLGNFNIEAERRTGRVGVWVDRTEPMGPMREEKIAAIGVRIRRWVSFHGISINIEPDLSHFQAIVPCGIAEPGLGVTSFVDLGLPVTMDEVDHALHTQFKEIFGPIAG